ncbi:MAG TPA: hypothetical protein PLZ42_05715 [Methanothrix sp.]|nr:hypothetical protein [Methanothrix sp.]
MVVIDGGNGGEDMMRSHVRTILAGVAAGSAMNLAMLLTFRLIGFGINADGILLDPALQSGKLIAVWTEIEPLPLVVDRPLPILLGIVLFGIVHAYLYRWISPSWPPGVARRGLSFALVVFLMTFLFWEFFTPFNLFGEPPGLIALELFFWAIIALADGFVISAMMERGAKK